MINTQDGGERMARRIRLFREKKTSKTQPSKILTKEKERRVEEMVKRKRRDGKRGVREFRPTLRKR